MKTMDRPVEQIKEHVKPAIHAIAATGGKATNGTAKALGLKPRRRKFSVPGSAKYWAPFAAVIAIFWTLIGRYRHTD